MAPRFAILLFAICFSAQAQVVRPRLQALTGDTTISQSQRFIVHSRDAGFAATEIRAGQVSVEPELLAVTAERIHKALAAEIAGLDTRGGEIHLHLLNQGAPNTSIPVQATLFRNGWEYRIGIPPIVEEKRLVKGLVTVILAEFANRNVARSADHPGADFPGWFIEGITRQILTGVGPTLVVDRRAVGWELASRDLHAGTRALLRTNPPPTFTELTWKAVPADAAPDRPAYEAASHLLVHSLLRMPGGPERCANFLKLLPGAWNWQTAFLHAFGFERLLDAEKWWALASLEYVTRDVGQAWSDEASLARLDELLATPVEIRAGTNSLPTLRSISLGEFLQTGDWHTQRKALNEKLTQLTFLSIHLAPNARALAIEYRKTLQTYLEKRDNVGVKSASKLPKATQEKAHLQEALRKISDLDSKRTALSQRGLTAAR